jgi:hypothetical protein
MLSAISPISIDTAFLLIVDSFFVVQRKSGSSPDLAA